MIESLENNEAVLLMYLAGELPPQDCVEVEQMLSADAGLRGELARLTSALEQMQQGLARLDVSDPLPPQPVVARRVGRAMRQAMAERAGRLAKIVKPKEALRFPWWAYPTAAAAAVFLAFITWVANYNVGDHRVAAFHSYAVPVEESSTAPTTEPAPAVPPPPSDPAVNELALDLENSFTPSAENDTIDKGMLALRDTQADGWSNRND